MKRTCNGCRALEISKGWFSCSLDYKIDGKKGRPEEECPKPTTVKKLITLDYKR